MTRPSLSTPAFEAFLRPARARPQIWRLLAGLVVIALVYAGWLALIAGTLWALAGRDGMMSWFRRMAAAVEPAPTYLLLATFIGLALAPIAAARLLHRRGAGSLIGRGPRVIRDFVRAALIVFVVYAVLLVPWGLAYDAEPNLSPGLWLRLLPLSLVAVAVQTLAEEMVFRGYLMQQLAVRFRWPLVWLVLPALAFGALHYDPLTHGGNAWGVVLAVTLFGLAAADLTRRTGSLGAAWGLHFANNTVALLVLATGGALPGLALWRTPYQAADPAMTGAMLGDLAAMLAIWAILARLLRR